MRHSLELAIGRSPARDPGEASEAFLDAMIVQIRYIIERSDLDDLTSKQVCERKVIGARPRVLCVCGVV